MGWVCFALFFSPRASPRDNSFVPTDVQNSPYQQEKMTPRKNCLLPYRRDLKLSYFNESNFNKYQPRYLN